MNLKTLGLLKKKKNFNCELIGLIVPEPLDVLYVNITDIYSLRK